MADYEPYIHEAGQWYNIALKEYEEAKEKKDLNSGIQACEKGYRAILKAVYALFLKEGVPEKELPETHRGIFFLLRKHASREQRKLFNHLYEAFHILGFHEGAIDFEDLGRDFEELKGFIEGVTDERK